jgi:hypothetical protein
MAARPHFGHFGEREIGRQILHPDRSVLHGREVRHRLRHVAGINDERLRARAPVVIEIRERRDTFADGESLSLRSNRIDDTCRLDPDAGGKPRKAEGIVVLHQVHIAPVQGEGLDTKPNLARAWLVERHFG